MPVHGTGSPEERRTGSYILPHPGRQGVPWWRWHQDLPKEWSCPGHTMHGCRVVVLGAPIEVMHIVLEPWTSSWNSGISYRQDKISLVRLTSSLFGGWYYPQLPPTEVSARQQSGWICMIHRYATFCILITSEVQNRFVYIVIANHR